MNNGGTFSHNGAILCIPKCIVLKDVPSPYVYDKTDNTVTVHASTGEPSSIALAVDYIISDPEKDENGRYFIKGSFLAGGHVCASANTAVRNFTLKMEVDIDSFKPKTITFRIIPAREWSRMLSYYAKACHGGQGGSVCQPAAW